jgi:hypothetical protein
MTVKAILCKLRSQTRYHCVWVSISVVTEDALTPSPLPLPKAIDTRRVAGTGDEEAERSPAKHSISLSVQPRSAAYIFAMG